MTSTLKSVPEDPPLTFPCLRLRLKAPAVVGLFSGPSYGTVVYTEDSAYRLGQHQNIWTAATEKEVWTPLRGTLELHN